MKAHSGRVLNVANAQNGIFLRDFAAATTALSGFGGGGPTGAGGGAAGAGTAGALAAVVAAAVPGAAGALSAAGAPPSACALAAWLRFSRCSGISVTGAHDRRLDAGKGKSSQRPENAPCTSSQPVDCGYRAW